MLSNDWHTPERQRACAAARAELCTCIVRLELAHKRISRVLALASRYMLGENTDACHNMRHLQAGISCTLRDCRAALADVSILQVTCPEVLVRLTDAAEMHCSGIV